MTALFKRLLKKDYAFYNKNSLIIKGTPDGEGIWASEINQKLVKAIRYKNDYTDEFINEVTDYIKTALKVKPLIFVDCGGMLDNSKYRIAECSTHSIIVSRDKNQFEDWIKVSKKLKIITEVESKLEKNKNNILQFGKMPIRLIMTDLERGNKNVKFPKEYIEYIDKYLRE